MSCFMVKSLRHLPQCLKAWVQPYYRFTLDGMSRKEIQTLAKANGIKANESTDMIIDRLLVKLPISELMAKPKKAIVSKTKFAVGNTSPLAECSEELEAGNEGTTKRKTLASPKASCGPAAKKIKLASGPATANSRKA